MRIPKFSTLLAICAAVIAAVVILPRLFPGLGGGFIWFLLLACPLMHIFMMKGHGHGDDASNSGERASHSCHGNTQLSNKDKQISGSESKDNLL